MENSRGGGWGAARLKYQSKGISRVTGHLFIGGGVV